MRRCPLAVEGVGFDAPCVGDEISAVHPTDARQAVIQDTTMRNLMATSPTAVPTPTTGVRVSKSARLPYLVVPYCIVNM